MKEVWKKFKKLTGYNAQDVSDMVHVSRQHISYLTTRDSAGITNKSAMCLWMDMMTDKKINSLSSDIEQLKQLKLELREMVAPGGKMDNGILLDYFKKVGTDNG